MHHEDVTTDVRKRIHEIVADRAAADLVSAYYADGSGFAGAMFDEFGANPDTMFTSDDIVAASLLDVRFGPTAVDQLLVHGRANEALAAVANAPQNALWNTDVGDDAPASHLWEILRGVEGIGPTRASKLMARKRPHLIPVVDSVIIDALGLPRLRQWRTLAAALDERTRDSIDELAVAAAPHTPSTLRLLDVAVWMRHSESTRARLVRKSVGLDVQPR